ncbi:Ankyrin repeat family, partial [Trichomonas vaginalis G3]|uniref:Ankyrin repeat family n=1 Tax=Trichomonas vaginalis (strain ATCC PRA-98 / G3) TaxID=412133 RepID=UPI0021E5B67F
NSPSYCSNKGKKEIVELLLSHRANVNAFDSLNRTPLHNAAIKGKKEIAELLLSHGANINQFDPSKSTPLHIAAIKGKKRLLNCFYHIGQMSTHLIL